MMLTDEELDAAVDAIEEGASKYMNHVPRHEAILIAGSHLLAKAWKECDALFSSNPLVNYAAHKLGISKNEIPLLNRAFELAEKGLRGPAMLLLCESPDIGKDRHGGDLKSACETCLTCIEIGDFLQSSMQNRGQGAGDDY